MVFPHCRVSGEALVQDFTRADFRETRYSPFVGIRLGDLPG